MVVSMRRRMRPFLLSDDGTRLVGGVPSKELPASQRQFRAVWVTLGDGEPGLAKPEPGGTGAETRRGSGAP